MHNIARMMLTVIIKPFIPGDVHVRIHKIDELGGINQIPQGLVVHDKTRRLSRAK